MSALLDVFCPECGRELPADQIQHVCEACDSPLLCRYDLAQVAEAIDPKLLKRRSAGIWRWHELLPVREAGYRLTLGEGDTALLRADRLAGEFGLAELYIKDEGVNPTGTFKARGMAVAVSRARELGVEAFVVPTAGNAGGALAAYAAAAGAEAHVFMPADSREVNKREVQAAGADLRLVDGLIDLAGREAAEAGAQAGWFDVSTFKEPYRVEGKKTMGLELAEALEWELPDAILYPTGGGTGLVGMWKAFQELQEMGWLRGGMPRMIAVQAEGCAPIVRALESNAPRAERWEGASTDALGLRVPGAYADRLILKAVRESGGKGVTVSEEEIRTARGDLAREEGILACLEGAATLAGLRRLHAEGWSEDVQRVVLFNTGTGLKDLL